MTRFTVADDGPGILPRFHKRIFQIFPLVFTFMLAPFAAGLVIYWSWNNLLSVMQQYFIMRRFKVENPIDSFLNRFSGKPGTVG